MRRTASQVAKLWARVIVAGVVSTAPVAGAAAQETPSTDAASAQVCFRRAAGASGWGVPLTVRQDGADLENFSVGEQRCFDVAPGRHEFGTLYWGRTNRSTTRPAATKDIEIAAGGCHYYKVVMGFWGVLMRETDDRRFQVSATCKAT